MSRCAHLQSTYKLQELPKCRKCKNKELSLVLASYNGKLVWEWECPQCNRAIPRHSLKEPKSNAEDIWLQKWCKNEARRREEEKNHYRTKTNTS